MIDKTVFRAYDIRGNSKKGLDTEIAYNIGWHFAKMNMSASNNRIVVGFDGRLSTPSLYRALISGLSDAGAEISSIGLAHSPLLYFADKKLYPAGSIMITGSHNQKNDNGFKMLAGGVSFFGDKIQDLLANIIKDTKKYKAKEVKVFNVNIRPHYIEKILKGFELNPDLKVVWDTGNASSGEIVSELINKLPNQNFIINGEVDGNFPNHHPDPTIPENLVQLQNEVEELGADLGIGFDGDADRIGVVTKNGRIVFGDELLCIYSKELLERKPKSLIIADVKASKVLFDYVASLGGKAIMWKTGHSLIKAKMQECSAEIAGEMSGHIFFIDGYLGFDDAIYAAIRLLSILSKSEITIDEMLEKLPKAYNTPELRLDVSDAKKFKIIDKLKEKLNQQKVEFIDIDGVRVHKEYGWWLARASNTQGAIIVRCEANTEDGLEHIIAELNDLISEFGLKIN